MSKGDMDTERFAANKRREAPKWPYVMGIVVVVAAIGIMLYVAREEPAPEVVADTGIPVESAAKRPELAPLPPTGETDAAVREALRGISPVGTLMTWLASEDLLRRFVGAVNQIADGKSPRAELEFLGPDDSFRVRRKGRHLYMDPRGFKRYDVVARVVASLDITHTTVAYAKLKPLLERAHQELGRPERTFEQTLATAIHHLVSTPVPAGRIEVVENHVLYVFADPGLESLSAAQKHLLRMGPSNMRTVQLKLKELALALKLPPVETASLDATP